VDAKSKTFEKINKLIVGSSNGQMFNDPEFSVTYLKNANSTLQNLLRNQLSFEIHQADRIDFPKNQSTVSQVNMTEASETRRILFSKTPRSMRRCCFRI
jgi:outer membrane lipoprotein carrier protein